MLVEFVAQAAMQNTNFPEWEPIRLSRLLGSETADGDNSVGPLQGPAAYWRERLPCVDAMDNISPMSARKMRYQPS